MPHCDIGLYQGLLKANWTREGMQKVLILGNPLDEYSLTTDKARLDAEFCLVKKLGSHPDWRITPIPNATCDDKAFVALALQHLQDSRDVGYMFEGSKSDKIQIENAS